MVWWQVTTIILFAIALAGLSWSVWYLRKEHQLFSSIMFKPRTYKTTVSSVEDMNELLEKLRCLSIEEQMLAIQQSFGRPVRFQLAMDDKGRAWLEAVSHYSPDGEDDRLWYGQVQDKDDKTAKEYTG